MSTVPNNCGKEDKNKYRNKRYNNKRKNDIIPELIRKGLCPVCKERSSEISMACAGMHTYCFECIKNWAESKKELSCPECRKVCSNFIVLPVEKDKQSEELKKFIESVKIIPNPNDHGEGCTCFDDEFNNTSVYSDWTMQHYVDNKKQLELYYKTKESFSEKDLSYLIHWKLVKISSNHSHPLHVSRFN